MVQIITGAEMAEAAKAARKRKPGRPPKAAATRMAIKIIMKNIYFFMVVMEII